MGRITDLAVELAEEKFIAASGPGGQNVNKVATAAQLRFDAAHSPSLPEDVRQRLIRLAGKRLTTEGVLVIDARQYRTQERNRQDALDRLLGLIRQATKKPKPRRKTRRKPAKKTASSSTATFSPAAALRKADTARAVKLIVAPSGIRRVASAIDGTHGMSGGRTAEYSMAGVGVHAPDVPFDALGLDIRFR